MATLFAPAMPAPWPRPLVGLAIVVPVLLAVFGRDVADLASLWWGSSTYQHCLFVIPIVAWLLWQRRAELTDVLMAGWAPGALLVLTAALVWLVGEAGDVALIRHLGVVLIVQASVVALLGPTFARAILFPLAYLLFLVPFGDEFVAPMQTLTATMTMALLDVAGVPATIDGVFITTPTGWFEVARRARASSFWSRWRPGALVAHVCFRSWRRRAAFMTAAIVVPILANGIRAFGTIWVAHHSSVAFATGFDHIVYGWVFFAVVMLVVMATSWRFFDRRIGDRWLGERSSLAHATTATPVVAAFVLAAAVVPVGWNAYAAAAGRVPLPAQVVLPDVPGWTRVSDVASPGWTPRFDGADHRLQARYADAGGARVDLAVALYGWQGEGRELVAHGQGAVAGDWTWASNGMAVAGGQADRMLGPNAVAREAVTHWIVGGRSSGDRVEVKLRTMLARLSGGEQVAAAIIVSAPDRATIDAFRASLGPPEPLAARLIAQGRR